MNQLLEQALDETAEENATAVDLLVRMVETPSVSGDEGAVAALLVEHMLARGYTKAFVDEAGNAVGVMGTGERQVALVGHIDTVPGVVPVRREGDLLYGRGSVDAKGPFATFVEAVARAGAREGWSFVVIGAVEEEAPTSKGARHVAPLYAPEACLIGEPSSWRSLTMGYKGRLLVDFALTRGIAHSAGPERATAEFAIDFWNAIDRIAAEFNEGKEKLFVRLDPSLLDVNTSSDDGGLHQTVRLTASFRLPLGFDQDAFKQQLRDAAVEDATIRFYGGEPAYRGDKNNPLVRAFLASIRDLGGKPGFKVKTGTSDMNVVGPAWQCPILAYGPGDSKLDHTPNEHVPISEFLKGVAALHGALDRLTS